MTRGYENQALRAAGANLRVRPHFDVMQNGTLRNINDLYHFLSRTQAEKASDHVRKPAHAVRKKSDHVRKLAHAVRKKSDHVRKFADTVGKKSDHVGKFADTVGKKYTQCIKRPKSRRGEPPAASPCRILNFES
jgi:hypothetical protein